MIKLYYVTLLRYQYNILNLFYDIKNKIVSVYFAILKKYTPINSLRYYNILIKHRKFLDKRTVELEKLKLNLNKREQLLQ